MKCMYLVYKKCNERYMNIEIQFNLQRKSFELNVQNYRPINILNYYIVDIT